MHMMEAIEKHTMHKMEQLCNGNLGKLGDTFMLSPLNEPFNLNIFQKKAD
jgi:hypothetical protein